MIKTLKGKIAVVYIFLVLMIAVVGLTSVVSIFKLSKSIDGLMVDNYKSINVANKMMEAIEVQNIAVLNYINENRENALEEFYKGNDEFYKWFNVGFNNITEKGEQDSIAIINSRYLEFLKVFSQIQEIKNKDGKINANEFYNKNVFSIYNELKNALKTLSLLNEKAMFNSKNTVTNNALEIMYIILVLSLIAVIGGFFISKFFLNKFLKPIYLLTETMKSVKEGNIEQQAPVLSNDEVGGLAQEFNKMTKRIQKLENSTKGKLLAEKNKSLAIVKSISDPLIVLDTNFKIILINSACEEVFNIVENDVLNKHFLEAIRYANLYDHIFNAYKEFEDNSKFKEEIISIESKGKQYHFNVVVSIAKDNEFKINEIVVFLQNVTGLKQLEKMKTDFIATISHEFKTPLTSIMMGLSLIDHINLGSLNEKQQKIIETIKDDTNTLSDLVTNLLHLSRIESDKALFNMGSCSIVGVVENSIGNFYDLAEANEVHLRNEINDELPKVIGDSEKLTWVVNNLISNSLKHTNAGDEIIVRAYANEGKMYVSVSDTGEGIPDQYHSSIFNKFVQVEEGSTEIKGSGLGLAISKEIVEVHGGEIWCESKLDEGSNFIFTLPIEEN